MRAASPPVSFSLRSLSSVMFLHHARLTRLAVATSSSPSHCDGAEGRYFRNTVRRSQHSNQ